MNSSQQINKSKRIFRATSRQRLIAAIVFASITMFFVVFAVAAHFHYDMGNLLGRCGLKQRYGVPCPTCGMTTATLAFAKGRIAEAFYIQPACGFLCSCLVLIAILSLFIAVTGIYFRFIWKFFEEVKIQHIILALIIIITSGWLVTLARALVQRN